MTDQDIRQGVAAPDGTPIRFVPGDAAPALLGRDGGYFSPTGKLIANPRGYQRAGGTCQYRAGDLRVEVGVGWLVQQIAGQSNA